ncbi:hypothetical protein [Corynebacterium glyciniphilum]|uniref:hypothetical protein n=1 Tax=Corynebacterium glyciniphilum TaxID=1404244 RepID=UPI00264D5D25|nr:hypothetical protein [Corynebacterium glyciniphilum]MDN5684531.1 hypothetical protein [Corynebacterium glyciniphilum]MDN6706558.1 hypothetical protein [Corynebacterium glyciniphilum]
MTQQRRWTRTAHRTHAAITVVVLVAVLVLNLTGTIGGGTALRLFLAVEVPLLVVFVVLTLLRLRRVVSTPAGDDRSLLDRVIAEEPLLRPAVSELRYCHSLVLAVAGKRRVSAGAASFGYTKGVMAVPAAIVMVSLVELVVVHLLVPWQWLRIVLLIFSIWGVLFVAGFFAARIVNPHLVSHDDLTLRWGLQTVLATPLSNVVSASRHANHAATQPDVEGNRLILTQFQSTNVVLRFAQPVATDAPVSKKHRPVDVRVTEVQLFVDDPEAFLHAVTPAQDEVSA